MLLLVALLVTGIPVMAVSAADTEATPEYVADITTLYVGADGSKTANGATLVGLYTAFLGETTAYDLATGKWHNKADVTGATDATLVDTTDSAAWAATANGGLTAGLYTQAAYDSAKNNVRIDLPDAWMADKNFTVKSAAVAYGWLDSKSVGYSQSFDFFRIDLMKGMYEAALAVRAVSV